MAKIRITENELKQIVAESVKKILSEGKVVNNKPLSNDTKKGVFVYEWSAEDIQKLKDAAEKALDEYIIE